MFRKLSKNSPKFDKKYFLTKTVILLLVHLPVTNCILHLPFTENIPRTVEYCTLHAVEYWFVQTLEHAKNEYKSYSEHI